MDTFINLCGIVLIPLAFIALAAFFVLLCGKAYENTTGRKP